MAKYGVPYSAYSEFVLCISHTHTHTRSSGQLMLLRPGSSWGFRAFLKGLTSVLVLKVEESPVYSLSPPTIPAGPETRTCDLWVTSLTLLSLGHDSPLLSLEYIGIL